MRYSLVVKVLDPTRTFIRRSDLAFSIMPNNNNSPTSKSIIPAIFRKLEG